MIHRPGVPFALLPVLLAFGCAGPSPSPLDQNQLPVVVGVSSRGSALGPMRARRRPPHLRSRRAAPAAKPAGAAAIAAPDSAATLLPRPDSSPLFSAAASDTEPEPVLVELQLGRLTSRTVQAFRVGSEVLVPVSEMLQLAEVHYLLSPEGRLEATLDPGNRKLIIDARRDTMTFGTQRVPVAPEFLLFRDGELYVGAERLGDLLGSRFIVSWADLTVVMADPSGLPVGRRAQREAAREAYRRRAAGAAPERALGLERPRWDGLVVDYSLLAPSSDVVGGGSYTVAAGADAFGGSLEVGAASIGGLDAGVARIDASWTGVWRDSRWLKQLRLGDGLATGPSPRTLRGAMLTNAPYVRPSLLGTTRYDGRLGPGWSVEAYRGADLVAFDSTDGQGRFAIDLPVRYGENPVDFTAYGPFGEIRQFNRTYRVLSELLPARTFEYGLSGGDCRSALCAATGNIDLRYGISPRATVRAGLERFWRDSLPDLSHPYAALTVAPATALALEVDGAAGAFARGVVRYEPSLDFRVTAEYTAFDRTTVAPILTPLGQRSHLQVQGFLRPVPGQGFFYLESDVQRTETDAGATTLARLGASFQASEIRVLPYARMERTTVSGGPAITRRFAGASASLLPRPSWGPVLGNLLLRSSLEAEQGGSGAGLLRLNAYTFSAARTIGPGTRLEAGVSWARGGGGATMMVVLSSYLPMLRSYTTVTAPAAGPALATQFIQGSLLWDRQNGRLRGAPGPSLERAGLVGRVFLDENGDGRYDPGEQLLPGVRVLVGSNSATTDSGGTFRVWDIVPFEPILVTVDSLTLDSPLLVPAFATASIVPGPNRFRTLDLPIVQAGVVEGQVTRDGRGVAGVTLVLADRRSGSRRRVVTFSDGAFYVLGVKPGDYELTVEPSVLEALGAGAEPVRFTLVPSAQGLGRSGIEVRIR
jgi:carboxypeptidase family protein